MMNNALVRRQAKALAEELLRMDADDDARARRAWRRLYSRPASDDEVRTLSEHRERFLKGGSTPAAAWTTSSSTPPAHSP
jgi:hypothetical protein